MSIREECGVFGVYSPRREEVASLVYYGLYALQYRGHLSHYLRYRNHRLCHSH